MAYDFDDPNRRSIRLKGYDYSQTGYYFVTICTQDRECWLGKIRNGEMELNEIGHMVDRIWRELPDWYPHVKLDFHVVMPNHFHGIVIIHENEAVGAGPRACPDRNSFYAQKGQPQGVAPTRLSLGDILHRFKSLTTTRHRYGVQNHNWQSFPGRLWQRNYYERIIRNEAELNKIREYILNNPAQWAIDENNPQLIAIKNT